jgi:hypothetical protein
MFKPRMKLVDHVAHIVDKINVFRILDGNAEEKIPFGSPRR